MLLLSDKDISKLLQMEEAINAVESAFKEYSEDKVVMPQRSTIMVSRYNGSISFMPSYLKGSNIQATKIISIYPDNKKKSLPTTIAWIIVNDPETGMIKAFMDATYITAMRTGAITGVAAKYLASDDSKTVAVFGAGIQARTQVLAISVVRDIKSVKVYDVYPELSRRFANEMTVKLGIPVTTSTSGREACKDADVVLTATTSSKPVLKREWLKKKAHVSAIGTFYPDYRELDTDTVAHSKLVVDDLNGVMAEAGDILIPIKEGAITKDHIYAELKDLVSGKKKGRTKDDDLTVFKSVGVAIQDNSVANLVLRKLGY